MLLAVSTTGEVRLLINASTQLETGSGRGAPSTPPLKGHPRYANGNPDDISRTI